MPAVCLHSLPKQAMMRLEDALRLLVASALQQLGGTDEVGEEDGDGLGPRGHVGECYAQPGEKARDSKSALRRPNSEAPGC